MCFENKLHAILKCMHMTDSPLYLYNLDLSENVNWCEENLKKKKISFLRENLLGKISLIGYFILKIFFYIPFLE